MMEGKMYATDILTPERTDDYFSFDLLAFDQKRADMPACLLCIS